MASSDREFTDDFIESLKCEMDGYGLTDSSYVNCGMVIVDMLNWMHDHVVHRKNDDLPFKDEDDETPPMFMWQVCNIFRDCCDSGRAVWIDTVGGLFDYIRDKGPAFLRDYHKYTPYLLEFVAEKILEFMSNCNDDEKFKSFLKLAGSADVNDDRMMRWLKKRVSSIENSYKRRYSKDQISWDQLRSLNINCQKYPGMDHTLYQLGYKPYRGNCFKRLQLIEKTQNGEKSEI